MNRGSTRRSSDRRSQEIGRQSWHAKREESQKSGDRRKKLYLSFLDITSALLKIFLRWKFWQRILQSRVKIFLNFLFKSFENWLTFRIKFISLQNFRIRFDKFLTRSNESYFRIVKKKKKFRSKRSEIFSSSPAFARSSSVKVPPRGDFLRARATRFRQIREQWPRTSSWTLFEQLPRKNASYFHVDAMESSRGPTVVSACGTRSSRLIRESLVGKSGGKSRGKGTPPCAYPVLNRDCGSPLTAPSPTERPTDVNWNRSIVWPCLSILLLLSFLSFFGEIHCADWKNRLRFFLMHILFFFLFSRSRNGNSIILEILYFQNLSVKCSFLIRLIFCNIYYY